MDGLSSPPRGIGYAAAFLAPGGVLIFLGLVTLAARIYTRAYPKRLLGWDDYTPLAAVASTRHYRPTQLHVDSSFSSLVAAANFTS